MASGLCSYNQTGCFIFSILQFFIFNNDDDDDDNNNNNNTYYYYNIGFNKATKT